MAERMLITRVKRIDQAGHVELYGRHHRWADLRCDLADLAAVLDAPALAALPVGEERPLSCWAVYELGKPNSKGTPYKDLVLLEPIAAAATTTSAAVADGALLAEVRRISALLEAMAAAQHVTLPAIEQDQDHGDGGDLDLALARFENGEPCPEAALQYYEQYAQDRAKAPADIDDLRAWARAHRK